MKKIAVLLLTMAILFRMCLLCCAAESTDDSGKVVSGDVYASYIQATNQRSAPVENGNASTVTESGFTVSITNAPNNAAFLKVVPILASEQEAWRWFQSCLGNDKKLLAVFDIYFEDTEGNRINANDVRITMTCGSEAASAYSVTTGGVSTDLNGIIRAGMIGFTADGSHYYVLAEMDESSSEHRVTISKPDGGDVEISDETPGSGDEVVITPIPDDGKEVKKVIVKDQNGNKITVTDNGDGTYSYEQPDGDVTIKVIFKDKTPDPAPKYNVFIKESFGGTVAVSKITPRAGDTVTISVNPDNGKMVNMVTVMDGSGKSVEVRKNSDGTYSYIQPNSNVTISVTFQNATNSGASQNGANSSISQSGTRVDNPKTGDSSNLFLWMSVMIISIIAIFRITFKKKVGR